MSDDEHMSDGRVAAEQVNEKRWVPRPVLDLLKPMEVQSPLQEQVNMDDSTDADSGRLHSVTLQPWEQVSK